MYIDLAVEHAGSFVHHHAAVQFIAFAMRHAVINGGVVIYQLISGSEIEAVEMCFGTLCVQGDVQVITDEIGFRQSESIIVVKAFAMLLHQRLVDDARLLAAGFAAGSGSAVHVRMLRLLSHCSQIQLPAG